MKGGGGGVSRDEPDTGDAPETDDSLTELHEDVNSCVPDNMIAGHGTVSANMNYCPHHTTRIAIHVTPPTGVLAQSHF